MHELIYAGGLAFLITLLTGPAVIPVLKRLKFGQSIRQEGPERHYKKAGTPTMGGLIIILAVTVAALVFAGCNREILLVLFITIGHGLLGFLDDFIKVVLKRSLGLKARQKMLGQIGLAYIG